MLRFFKEHLGRFRFALMALVATLGLGLPLSALAQADTSLNCAEVIGSVFEDLDGNGAQNKGEVGIPGVRIINTRGYNITTDADGRYHLPCAAIPREGMGSNYILKVMKNSLPAAFEMTTENPRVFRLTEGKASTVNFGTRLSDAVPFTTVRFEIADHAFADNSAALKSDMKQNIDELIGVLVNQPTSLILVHTGQKDVVGRVQALTNLIKTDFRDAGGRYDLNISAYDAAGQLLN